MSSSSSAGAAGTPSSPEEQERDQQLLKPAVFSSSSTSSLPSKASGEKQQRASDKVSNTNATPDLYVSKKAGREGHGHRIEDTNEESDNSSLFALAAEPERSPQERSESLRSIVPGGAAMVPDAGLAVGGRDSNDGNTANNNNDSQQSNGRNSFSVERNGSSESSVNRVARDGSTPSEFIIATAKTTASSKNSREASNSSNNGNNQRPNNHGDETVESRLAVDAGISVNNTNNNNNTMPLIDISNITAGTAAHDRTAAVIESHPADDSEDGETRKGHREKRSGSKEETSADGNTNGNKVSNNTNTNTKVDDSDVVGGANSTFNANSTLGTTARSPVVMVGSPTSAVEKDASGERHQLIRSSQPEPRQFPLVVVSARQHERGGSSDADESENAKRAVSASKEDEGVVRHVSPSPSPSPPPARPAAGSAPDIDGDSDEITEKNTINKFKPRPPPPPPLLQKNTNETVVDDDNELLEKAVAGAGTSLPSSSSQASPHPPAPAPAPAAAVPFHFQQLPQRSAHQEIELRQRLAAVSNFKRNTYVPSAVVAHTPDHITHKSEGGKEAQNNNDIDPDTNEEARRKKTRKSAEGKHRDATRRNRKNEGKSTMSSSELSGSDEEEERGRRRPNEEEEGRTILPDNALARLEAEIEAAEKQKRRAEKDKQKHAKQAQAADEAKAKKDEKRESDGAKKEKKEKKDKRASRKEGSRSGSRRDSAERAHNINASETQKGDRKLQERASTRQKEEERGGGDETSFEDATVAGGPPTADAASAFAATSSSASKKVPPIPLSAIIEMRRKQPQRDENQTATDEYDPRLASLSTTPRPPQPPPLRSPKDERDKKSGSSALASKGEKIAGIGENITSVSAKATTTMKEKEDGERRGKKQRGSSSSLVVGALSMDALRQGEGPQLVSEGPEGFQTPRNGGATMPSTPGGKGSKNNNSSKSPYPVPLLPTGSSSGGQLVVDVRSCSVVTPNENIVHPFVRVWLLNGRTGQSLAQGCDSSLDGRPCGVTYPFDIRSRKCRSPTWEHEICFDIIEGALSPSNDPTIFFEFLDFGDYAINGGFVTERFPHYEGLYPIGWGFYRVYPQQYYTRAAQFQQNQQWLAQMAAMGNSGGGGGGSSSGGGGGGGQPAVVPEPTCLHSPLRDVHIQLFPFPERQGFWSRLANALTPTFLGHAAAGSTVGVVPFMAYPPATGSGPPAAAGVEAQHQEGKETQLPPSSGVLDLGSSPLIFRVFANYPQVRKTAYPTALCVRLRTLNTTDNSNSVSSGGAVRRRPDAAALFVPREPLMTPYEYALEEFLQRTLVAHVSRVAEAEARHNAEHGVGETKSLGAEHASTAFSRRRGLGMMSPASEREGAALGARKASKYALLDYTRRRDERSLPPSTIIHEQSLSGAITAMAMCPDNRFIAVATQTNFSSCISVFDSLNPMFTLVASLKGHADLIHSLCFSQNGQLLASGSADKTAKVWNLANLPLFVRSTEEEMMACIATYSHGFSVYGAVFISNVLIVAGYDTRLHVWRVPDGPLCSPQQNAGEGAPPPINHAVFMGGDGYLAAFSGGGGGEKLERVGRGGGIGFITDGSEAPSNAIRSRRPIFNADAGADHSHHEGLLVETVSHATAFILFMKATDTNRLWTIDSTHQLSQWRAELSHEGSRHFEALRIRNRIECPGATSADIRGSVAVVSCPSEQCVLVIDATACVCVQKIATGRRTSFVPCALTPDAKLAIVGAGNGRLLAWEAASGELYTSRNGYGGKSASKSTAVTFPIDVILWGTNHTAVVASMTPSETGECRLVVMGRPRREEEAIRHTDSRAGDLVRGMFGGEAATSSRKGGFSSKPQRGGLAPSGTALAPAPAARIVGFGSTGVGGAGSLGETPPFSPAYTSHGTAPFHSPLRGGDSGGGFSGKMDSGPYGGEAPFGGGPSDRRGRMDHILSYWKALVDKRGEKSTRGAGSVARTASGGIGENSTMTPAQAAL